MRVIIAGSVAIAVYIRQEAEGPMYLLMPVECVCTYLDNVWVPACTHNVRVSLRSERYTYVCIVCASACIARS